MDIFSLLETMEQKNKEKTIKELEASSTKERSTPMKRKLKIVAATDGACLGNPGVGGYAVVMEANGKRKEISGCCKEQTTNNRMELQAVISLVDWLNEVQKEPCDIEVQTDSQYIMSCHTHDRDWLTSKSRKNSDLWMELIQKGLEGGHFITFVKVKGHSGHSLNERADELATSAARRARHEVYN